MLILSRYPQEKICIGDNIVITIIRVNHNQVVVGIDAPREIEVHREEIKNKIFKEMV